LAEPRRVRWGVLGVARIAQKRVLPMMPGAGYELLAVASRDLAKAREAAGRFGAPRAYGSYEELLADPDVDAVYNPLPNHLHVPLSRRALERGKHVLVEKPVALSSAEAGELLAARERSGLKVCEAFMVRSHPQWLRARELLLSGRIGALRAIVGSFTYFNDDPANVRNRPEWGGGALLDVGCYPVTMSRFVFGEEPLRALAFSRHDPVQGIDRLTSALLDFPSGQAIFTCSMDVPLSQRMQILGTKGHVTIEIPWSPPTDGPTRLLVDDGRDLLGSGVAIEEIPACDHYRIQLELFSKAILEDGPVPVPLEDSIGNMRALEAIVRSAQSGRSEAVES
jgi:predicted dehydrogenase